MTYFKHQNLQNKDGLVSRSFFYFSTTEQEDLFFGFVALFI